MNLAEGILCWASMLTIVSKSSMYKGPPCVHGRAQWYPCDRMRIQPGPMRIGKNPEILTHRLV